MRGDREKACLEFVKAHINTECFYGFNDYELAEIKESVESAIPNENKSEFPDFKCSNGFIEHFQVTSGKTTRKGSEHLKEQQNYKTKITDCLQKRISDGDIVPSHFQFNYPQHRYVYLKDSIEQTTKKHINSCNNYNGCKETGVFMIEYQDSVIEMRENIYSNCHEGRRWGHLRTPQEIDHYSLVRDKDILNVLCQYRETIKYIIYVSKKGCEVINLNMIDEINKLFPFDFCIAALQGTIRLDTFIPMPNNNGEDNE